MHYKTIIFELLQQRPQMHAQLRKYRILLPALEVYATELRNSHLAWKDMLAEDWPGKDPSQIESEALELALMELRDRHADRISPGRGTVPRRSDGVPPRSYAARVRKPKQPLLDFDAPPPSAPPGGSEDGTIINPPGRASGQSVPPEGLPQFSAGPAASLPAGADSPSCLEPPDAGQETQGGDHDIMSTQLAFEFQPTSTPPPPPGVTRGDKAKARDILAAIRTLKQIEQEKRPATLEEGLVIQRFWGFGPVALSMFPDPVTGRYKDASWKDIGSELKDLLTPEEYASAKRTTFNAFYTSPTVINAIHDAIARLGVPRKPRSWNRAAAPATS